MSEEWRASQGGLKIRAITGSHCHEPAEPVYPFAPEPDEIHVLAKLVSLEEFKILTAFDEEIGSAFHADLEWESY